MFLRNAIKNMERITKINEFDVIACDMHPHFFTTRLAHELAEKYDAEVLPVQHHHAHTVALANDHGIDEMISISADGVGYGGDGTSWGGEILYTDINSFERMAHLEPQLMPGGDVATRYPARMLASILKDDDLIGNYIDYFKYGEVEIRNIKKQIDAGINVGVTTSTGRVLDSMAVALEICHERTYEGECSMKLESAAYYSTKELEIPVIVEGNQLNTTEILREVVRLYQKGEKKADVAAAGQIAVARGLSELAIRSCDKKSIRDIGATGGVFYNEAITDCVKNHVENNGYNFIQHLNSCAGDGSVSLGQSIIGKKV
jgi:hydrogenase maturation protein HypF